jgi:hypothetical protein
MENSNIPWVEKVLESPNHIHRARLDSTIVERIVESALTLPHTKKNGISKQQWLVAASIAVLITFNLFSLVHYSGRFDSDQLKYKQIGKEYFSYLGK